MEDEPAQIEVEKSSPATTPPSTPIPLPTPLLSTSLDSSSDGSPIVPRNMRSLKELYEIINEVYLIFFFTDCKSVEFEDAIKEKIESMPWMKRSKPSRKPHMGVDCSS